ncbi:MAG: hypothetical protein M1831_002449 [Alyxoria varia]|nr:MAG: hypothetical protein M1831_002449 [Alyxoria varia]
MHKKILDRALQRCKVLGVKNILALRGDEPRGAEYEGMEGDMSVVEGLAEGDETSESPEEEVPFTYAIDLVRYIRRMYGDYFCIGVAAYPEGHAVSPNAPMQSPENDFPHLIEKVQAGADFIMTQLFYDVDAFLQFETLLRERDKDGVLTDKPIIPGLMPVQSWGILTRTTKLTCAKVPKQIWETLEESKGDDAAVKQVGVQILHNIITRIQRERKNRLEKQGTPGDTSGSTFATDKNRILPQGFHFYTLNLEKAVAQILEQSNLIPLPAEPQGARPALNGHDQNGTAIDDSPTEGVIRDGVNQPQVTLTKDRRRLSSRNSGPHNRVVVSRPSGSSSYPPAYEAPEDEAGVPRAKETSRADALAISEGEGSLGREATWDDYPNGRWGDARSPAYGSIDGYGPSLHFPPSTARTLWGHPTTPDDITHLFQAYLSGTLPALPWSEESLSAETALIREELRGLNAKGWWTMASQPAVDAASSADSVVGWGPKCGGWVWQKPFVEFFIPTQDWERLKRRLDEECVGSEEVTYFAGNAQGDFVSSHGVDVEDDAVGVNPVTWGAFRGKEIITPTLIDPLSFRAWRDEAFEIWREWARVYHGSGGGTEASANEASKFLREMRNQVYLVNVVGHRFQRKTKADERNLWDILLAA